MRHHLLRHIIVTRVYSFLITTTNNMTNEQILKKAIKKAVDNGMECSDGFSDYIDVFAVLLLRDKSYLSVIFLHDFAKAFWGDEYNNVCSRGCQIHMGGEGCSHDLDNKNDIYFHGRGGRLDGWQYHLQQMVLEEDPIKYLEKFI